MGLYVQDSFESEGTGSSYINDSTFNWLKLTPAAVCLSLKEKPSFFILAESFGASRNPYKLHSNSISFFWHSSCSFIRNQSKGV